MKKLSRQFDLTKEVAAALRLLPQKAHRQIVLRILDLAENPEPQDSRPLRGKTARMARLRRIDEGEYRIVYRYDDSLVEVLIVGHRNDGKVYQNLEKHTFSR